MPLSQKYDTITIERKTGGDFSTLAWSTVSSASDKGFIQVTSGNETFQEGKAGEEVTHRMYSPTDNTAVKYGDMVGQDSQKFIVIYSIQHRGISSQSHHLEILLGLFE